MNEVEELLIKAHKKGYYEDVMNEAQILKQSNPEMGLKDRYFMAYYKIKSKKK
jgi:hypothetical protein